MKTHDLKRELLQYLRQYGRQEFFANCLYTGLDLPHQNAALAEQSAAAAASLRQQASHLSGLVHRFKLGEDTSIFSS